MGCVWVYIQKMKPRYKWEYDIEKKEKYRLNEKRSLIPWRLRVPIWKINFCSSVLRLTKGLTLETSVFLLFTLANLRFQLSC